MGHCVPLLVGHCVRLVSLHSLFVSGLVSLLVGHCVRLVSLLFPFVSLLVSLLVDHCVRRVSLLLSFASFLSPSCWSLCPPRPLCLPLSPVLSPFCFLLSPSLLPVLSSFCLFLSLVLSSSLLVTVSVLSPFCFLLCPFLLVIVSALSPFCLHLFPVLSPFLLGTVSLVFPFVFLLVSLFPLHVPPLSPSRLQPFTFVSQLLCLATLYICLPLSTFVSQLWTAVSASALQSFTFVSQLWAAVSALQSFTFVSQRWAAVSASALQSLILHLSPSSDCCVRLCLAILYMCPRKPLHLSPSSRLLYPPLPCNPLFVTQLWAACRLQSFTFVSLCVYICLPALDCCGRLCLAILVSQLWTSQALVAECSDLKTQTVWGLRWCNSSFLLLFLTYRSHTRHVSH